MTVSLQWETRIREDFRKLLTTAGLANWPGWAVNDAATLPAAFVEAGIDTRSEVESSQYDIPNLAVTVVIDYQSVVTEDPTRALVEALAAACRAVFCDTGIIASLNGASYYMTYLSCALVKSEAGCQNGIHQLTDTFEVHCLTGNASSTTTTSTSTTTSTTTSSTTT